MRIAITADLHWGHNSLGDDANRLLVRHLLENPPDLVLLGGDIGTEAHFDECLEAFAPLPSIKALIPGNHDLWVAPNDARGDSLNVYQHHLPAVCKRFGVHYLDHAPLKFAEAGLAIVGSINWYDYSWAPPERTANIPDWQWRLSRKAFTRGRHNDGRFVVWNTDDIAFTRQVVEVVAAQLDAVLAEVGQAIVITHHPAFPGVGFPHTKPPESADGLLWAALSGNAMLEEVLKKYASRVPLILSGHTHRATEGTLGPARGINIGGDYHFKRMLVVDWPSLNIETFEFGDPNKQR